MKSTSKLRKSTTHKEQANHWCPPKPLVGLQVLEKLLNRHTAVACPESRLVVAVIALAIQDCLDRSDPQKRREARRFILGPHLYYWCDLVGLHPDFVRAIATKAGYLALEERYWQRIPVKAPMLTQTEDNADESPTYSTTCH